MNFYCQKVCGEQGFSIDEWNKASNDLDKTNLSEKEKQDILFPAKCTNQCFDCIAIIGQRQSETKALMRK